MAAVALVRWQELSEHDQLMVRSLKIGQQQIEYAGSIEKAIESVQGTDDAVGLAITAERLVVGFLVLTSRSKAPKWAAPNAASLSAMRIDELRQGQGLGSAALQAVSTWVGKNWPHSSTLTLRVDEGNVNGIRAYEKAGFTDHGVRIQGRIGFERLMSKQVAAHNALSQETPDN